MTGYGSVRHILSGIIAGQVTPAATFKYQVYKRVLVINAEKSAGQTYHKNEDFMMDAESI